MSEEMDQEGGLFFFISVVWRISGLNLEQYLLSESDKRWWLIFIGSSEKCQLLLSESYDTRGTKKKKVVVQILRPVSYYRFVEFMKNWTENEMPAFMSVAFSSERSIQDELERVSQAEMITVVISYAVMFVYIAVALGHFRSLKTLLVSSPCHSGVLGTNPWPLPETYAPVRHLINHMLAE